MRRTVLAIVFAIGIATIAGLSTDRVDARSAHGFRTTWCEAPILIPLASESGAEIVAADGVVTARGTEPVRTDRGLGIAMVDRGSRVQVTFGQTLFHTQWLFGSIDPGDSVRVDATVGSRRKPIAAGSVRGGLVTAPEQSSLGLTAIAREGGDSVGEIDVFVGASEVMFTNESDGPIELIGAIGCPALSVSSETLTAPTWNAESQRFEAEYEITFSNRLANARTAALRIQDPDTASSVIDDLGVELDLRAPGFSAADIRELELSTDLERRRSTNFDGRFDPNLLETPLRLDRTGDHTIRLAVGYLPDFSDPAWEEGVNSPAPVLRLRGQVDDLPVGVVATLHQSGAQIDALPSQLPTPSAGVTIEHEMLREPTSTPDGIVSLSERMRVTNIGESALTDLVVEYSYLQMYGEGTRIVEIAGVASRGCGGNYIDRFNGIGRVVAVVDEAGLDVGAECIIDIRTRLLPGQIPTAEGTSYEAPVQVRARSGARDVRDAAAVRTTLSQNSDVAISIVAPTTANLRDGRYRFTGELQIRNIGDQALRDIASRIDFTNSTDGEAAPFEVIFEEFTGTDTCPAVRVPRRATSGSLISNAGELAAGETCTVTYSVIARPFAKLDNWTVAGFATAVTPRGVTIEAGPRDVEFELAEAPKIDVDVAIVDIINNANGNYTVQIDTTVTNTGDTPLVTATAATNAEVHFADHFVALDRTVNTCFGVSWSDPLTATGEPGSCITRDLLVVTPGADLTGWAIEATADATSTSGQVVDASAESDEFGFTEAPAIVADVELLGAEKVDDGVFRYRLTGSIRNRGDIELRNVGATLALDEIFDGADLQIERIGANGVTISDQFDGVVVTELLTGNDVLPIEGVGRWDLTLIATTGHAPGPFIFGLDVEATSPATETLNRRTPTVSRALPIVRVQDHELTPSNNGDGTYEITHRVRARNVGGVSVPRINVFTDLEDTFGGFIIGDVDVTTTCNQLVLAGEGCTQTQTARLRPGSAIGPYNINVSIAAVDAEGLRAAVVGAPDPRNELIPPAPVYFEEAPSIELGESVSGVTNNNDGTYSLSYRFDVANTGDVPLYKVSANNPIADSFADRIVANQLAEDTCSTVRFGNALAPGQQCSLAFDVVIRPLDQLGPWEPTFRATVESPTFARVVDSISAEAVTFEETVELDASSNIEVRTNNSDGSYNVDYTAEVTNTGDVPLIEVIYRDRPSRYVGIREGRFTGVEDCAQVSFTNPLLPDATCSIRIDDSLRPGSNLGPYSVPAEVSGRSPSGQAVSIQIETNEFTMTEDPEVELRSRISSVEAVEPDVFRVVTVLEAENTGDVRISDLELELDLDTVFPDSVYRIDGVISDDFVVEEAYEASESTQLVAPGQTLFVGQTGSVVLVISVEPEGQPGPFVGELRASGTSPAGEEAITTLAAQIDLPSVSVDVVTQSVDNNRDGSYTVTTSYAVENDGSTTLEFVRLREDLAEIYAGTRVQLLSIDSTDIATANVEDRRRGTDLIEWGQSLGAGERAVVTSTVLVTPGNVLGPFLAEVRTSAQSPAETPVFASQIADDAIEFVEQPALRVEQRLLRRPEWNSTGRFDVTFGIDVINDGDVELRSLQIREDLLAALGANARIVVRDIRSETLTVNTDFDGLGRPPAEPEELAVDTEDGDSEETTEPAAPVRQPRDIGDTRVLAGWDTLPAGATASIEIDVTITPETRGVYSTRVVVSARTPAGTGVGSDGEVIEANTLTRLSVQGELGVAKRTIDEPRVRPDGSVGVSYEILVENVGPFPLSNVEVHDQLSQAFGVGSTFVTSRVRIEAGSPCVGHASSSYDGGTIDPVLISGVDLQPGERCRIQYDAAVIPSKELPGPFRSSAVAIASDPFSGTVIDDSTDGTNVDPDGNQEPGDNDIATAVEVQAPDPELVLVVEAIESTTSTRDGWHEFGYLVTVENRGAIDIDSTRLLAELDEAWDFNYSVVDISSDTLLVNEGFDGDRDTNLIARNNRLRAGDTAEVELRVQSAVPRDGQVPLALTFRADSVTDVPIEVGSPELTIEAARAEAVSTGTWFDSLTTEEKRLLALGAGAIVLFLLIFAYSTIKRFRAAVRRRRDAKRPLEPTIDLRSGEEIDLRTRRATSSAGDTEPNATELDPHHRPRRRRGRRATRQKQ